ncbi:hypothetical protein WA026_017938 [Henosepilachna vigintioctopunctata]|uniref:TIL domain-containing protein n=1 Tax=Henosepilachna vigintioctopunctata TaxID=420089 RepID=A0AAW1TVT4_9CUCU
MMTLKAIFILATCVVLVFSSSLQKCGPNEEWTEWRTACSPTCEFRNPPCLNITIRPPPGCECKPGYIYLKFSKRICVKISECPKTCSKPIFEWTDCGTRCRRTCLHPDLVPCVERCEAGCFCPDDYVLDDRTIECVKKKHCSVP